MKSDDSFGYVSSAYSIYDGKGMRIEVGQDSRETAYWAPLVPHVVAWTSKLVGIKTVLPMKTINVVLMLLSCVSLTQLGKMAGNEPAGKLSSILWALYVPVLTYVARVNYTAINACLFIILLSVVTAYLRKPNWRQLVLVAIVQGLMFYNLGTSLLLLPFVVVMIRLSTGFDKEQKRSAVALCIPWLVALASTAPWVVRNYELFNRPMFMQMSGYTLFQGNKAAKLFFDDPWSYGQTEPLIHRDYIGPSMRKWGVSTYEEWDPYSYIDAVDEIVHDPFLLLKKMLIMAIAYWYFAMTPIHSLVYAAYAIPLLTGFILYLRKTRPRFPILLGIMFGSYFYLFSILGTAQARYSLPCIPILILCCSLLLTGNEETIEDRIVRDPVR